MNIDMLPYTLLCYLFLTIILELVLSLILGLRKKAYCYIRSACFFGGRVNI